MSVDDVTVARHLLDLQVEFQTRDELATLGAQFGNINWQPRTKDEIAAEYAETLRDFMSH